MTVPKRGAKWALTETARASVLQGDPFQSLRQSEPNWSIIVLLEKPRYARNTPYKSPELLILTTHPNYCMHKPIVEACRARSHLSSMAFAQLLAFPLLTIEWRSYTACHDYIISSIFLDFFTLGAYAGISDSSPPAGSDTPPLSHSEDIERALGTYG